MSHPLAPYLKRFFSHYLLLPKGLSPQSLAAYRDAVKLLLCYSADQLTCSVDALEVESLSPERVSDFLDHLEHKRGCCTATRNARLAAIRTLFAFIAREENARILGLDDQVSLSDRDYRDGEHKTLTLDAPEFIRRFLLHLLPKGLMRVRHYGCWPIPVGCSAWPISARSWPRPSPSPRPSKTTSPSRAGPVRCAGVGARPVRRIAPRRAALGCAPYR